MAISAVLELIPLVALRKESVDRNTCRVLDEAGQQASLSARRAWIEIYTAGLCLAVIASLSARRAWIEMSRITREGDAMPSLSARRAWIEIAHLRIMYHASPVALRKESVDRN